MRVYLVRHGRTRATLEKRYSGHLDDALDEEGVRQAAALRDLLAPVPFVRAYSSDLERASQTARAIIADGRVELTSIAALREINFGTFEGRTYEEILQLDPTADRFWTTMPPIPFPGGESKLDLEARVRRFLDEHRPHEEDGHVLIVAHGGPLQEIYRILAGIPQGVEVPRLAPGACIILERGAARTTFRPARTAEQESEKPAARAAHQRVLLSGGARSGKSTHALHLAAGKERVLFVATATASDTEMTERIERHRKERPAAWSTLEAATSVARRIEAIPTQHSCIIVDCITLLVNNVMMDVFAREGHEDPFAPSIERAVQAEVAELVQLMARVPARWIIVTNEVGWGIVPMHPWSRAYRDLLGRANQRLAAACDEVVLMVSGIPLPIKGPTLLHNQDSSR